MCDFLFMFYFTVNCLYFINITYCTHYIGCHFSNKVNTFKKKVQFSVQFRAMVQSLANNLFNTI